MAQSRPSVALPKLFVREWMKIRDIPNQKALAGKMGRSEGAVSKKLQNPARIDLEWLAEFAAGLGVSVQSLFSDPSGIPIATENDRPMLQQLMETAAQLSDKRIESLLVVLSAPPPAAAEPPGQREPEGLEGQ